MFLLGCFFGTLGRTRTCDLRIRTTTVFTALFGKGLWSGLYLDLGILHSKKSFRPSPSSLYTFSFRNLARCCHFKGFTEFEELHSQRFHCEAQFFRSPSHYPLCYEGILFNCQCVLLTFTVYLCAVFPFFLIRTILAFELTSPNSRRNFFVGA